MDHNPDLTKKRLRRKNLLGASAAAAGHATDHQWQQAATGGHARREVDRSAAGKDFFSEEKKQKTFIHWCARCGNAYLLQSKVFWFFFSKKNGFLSLPAAPRQAIGTDTNPG